MARMIYDIKVPDNDPKKAHVNRLCYDGTIPEMISMLLYPIFKMYESALREWGVSGGASFKQLLNKGLDMIYTEGLDGYIKAKDQGGT